ncbi:MAG: phosphoenolpyruvate carboxykinase (ATP) [Deltaproteobacteria bacterium]|nr:phosphoenolpyruvate carboxykinase (ATP) [Deltaproteobacteria bacterium]
MKTDWTQHPNARVNLSAEELIQAALERNEGSLAANGALVVATGKFTGRSPNDRFFVKNGAAESAISWSKTNKPFSPEAFDKLLGKMTTYLNNREVFIHDGYTCADTHERFTIRTVTEQAWHNLFVHQLFLRFAPGEKISGTPGMTILCAPNFKAKPQNDGTNSDAFIILNFEKKIILIGGTHYAGEMKKSIFTTLNYLLPGRGILTMHCSANVGEKGDTALFFGLSGTGKTTLSADNSRRLIGDDEHAWSDKGIFNIEGGCYAKCIRLSQEFEPQIWNAIRKGTVLENVVMNPETKELNYNDDTLTENTRAAYPIEYIDNAVIPGVGGHPQVIFFLTADAFGVLPPLSKLTPDEAMYHFLSGYTAKLAGTEAGVKEPQATFSNCFGAPFLPRAANFYAKMFGEKLRKHNVPVYLINTGWQGGPYGIGKRISLPHTRAMINACLKGELSKVTFTPIPQFHLSIPSECPGVPIEILNPRKSWDDESAYITQAEKLAELFTKNFAKF